MEKQFVISVKTILLTLVGILGVYVLYRLGPIVGLLLISLLLVLALEPLVQAFVKVNVLNKPLGRTASVLLSYVLFISVIVVLFTMGLPPVLAQSQKLVNSLGDLLARYQGVLPANLSVTDYLGQITTASSGILAVIGSSFNAVTTFLSIFMLSLYMSFDWLNIKVGFTKLWPKIYQEEVENIINEIEVSIGHWVKGQLMLMFFVGGLSYVGLSILDVDYPLALGIIAGILEIIPLIGPVLTAILAGIVAFVDAPVKGLAVILLFTGIQQIENNILVPKIMQKVSGFSPLFILVALLILSNFFGIVGAILAVPMMMVAVIVVKSILRHTS